MTDGVGKGLRMVNRSRLQKCGDGCPRPATAIATREERFLSRYYLGSDGPFDNVGIDFDTTVEEEAPESLASGRGVADRLRQFSLPEMRGNSVSQSLKRSATMVVERSRRARQA
jgi:hypothetical protein